MPKDEKVVSLKNFVVDHYPPNQFHTSTGIFLLWELEGEERLELVDWELYSTAVSRGDKGKVQALEDIMAQGMRHGAIVHPGRGLE